MVFEKDSGTGELYWVTGRMSLTRPEHEELGDCSDVWIALVTWASVGVASCS